MPDTIIQVLSSAATGRIPLVFISDGGRNLVCKPYSFENLHRMANSLGISKDWFSKDHYVVPPGADWLNRIKVCCEVLSPKEAVAITGDWRRSSF
jgi:hypothetical protein